MKLTMWIAITLTTLTFGFLLFVFGTTGSQMILGACLLFVSGASFREGTKLIRKIKPKEDDSK